jgi:predicted nucleic acid-binding protein
MNKEQAWRAYDCWLQAERVEYLDESAGIETYFRDLTRSPHSATKDWADSYLAAFAVTSRLTVVTSDRAFKHKAKELVLPKA